MDHKLTAIQIQIIAKGNITIYSRDMGQMVYNYKRVIKGIGCMTIKG